MTTSRILITVAAMFVLLAAVALEIDRQSHRQAAVHPESPAVVAR